MEMHIISPEKRVDMEMKKKKLTIQLDNIWIEYPQDHPFKKKCQVKVGMKSVLHLV